MLKKERETPDLPARTRIVNGTIQTFPSILARISFGAVINVMTTIHPCVPHGTMASVTSREVGAGRRRMAGLRSTFVDILLATRSSITMGTHALVAADTIDAAALVQARLRSAIINVDFAKNPGITRKTLTLCAVLLVRNYTLCAMFARVILMACVYERGSDGAVRASITRVALAFVIVHLIEAFSVNARFQSTLVSRVFTMLAMVTSFAHAFVVVDFVRTNSPVQTRRGKALVNVCLAILASKTRKTVTTVIVRQVDARSAI